MPTNRATTYLRARPDGVADCGSLILTETEQSGMIPPFAQRLIAGETPAEAVAHAARLNSDSIAS